MQDVQIDQAGQLHCWNCGNTHFSERRTGTFWAAVVIGGALTIGVFALLALIFVKPKLQCRTCNEWNRPGNAQPFSVATRSDVTHNPQGHLPSRRTQGG